MRGVIVLTMLLAGASLAKSSFVFEERPGRNYTQGEARWRDALLRASVGGCKERLPPGSRLRPGIRDCVVNQVHVTNLSAHPLECLVTLEFPEPDDDGRRRIEHTIHIAPNKERWLATSYGPSTLVPSNYSTHCEIVRAWSSNQMMVSPDRA
jgi:hypothetical protein